MECRPQVSCFGRKSFLPVLVCYIKVEICFFFLFVEGTERDDKTCSDLGCLGTIINNDLLS